MPSYQIKQGSAAYPLVFLMVDSADHIAGKTGLTPTVTIRKVGGTFAAPAGAASEVGSGWYQVAGNVTDSNTLGPLLLHATATGADPTDTLYEVVAFDPQAAGNLGLANLDAAISSRLAAASYLAPDNATIAAIASHLPGRLTKNAALNNFEFLMVDSADHLSGKTGLAVTSQRSIDGGAFANCANTASEVGNGVYKINLAAADLNGDVITFRFTATGADARFLTVVTQP